MVHQGFIPDRWDDGPYAVFGTAKALGVFKDTIYTWIYGGRLQAQPVGKGTPWKIVLDEEKITELNSTWRESSALKGRRYEGFGDPTLADTSLDRLVHIAQRIQLEGESQRKLRAQRSMPNT